MIVHVAFKNGIDWSDGRSYFQGVHDTEEQALEGLGLKREDRIKWKAGDPELRAYFSVRQYDTATGKRVE